MCIVQCAHGLVVGIVHFNNVQNFVVVDFQIQLSASAAFLADQAGIRLQLLEPPQGLTAVSSPSCEQQH